MSAVCGRFHFDGAPCHEELLAPMMERLAFYGRDGQGTWSDGTAALGNRLLHATPESLNEKLPLQDHESGFVITADARIDNRSDLASKLQIGQLDDRTDSWLILQAYRKWGQQCVDHLVGDFLFVIYDPHQAELFCARDHLGLRPCYYYQDSSRFLIASDPIAILRTDGVPWRLNELALADLMVRCRNSEQSDTLFDGIKKLPPAHTLTVSKRGLSTRRYWTPDLSRETRMHSDEEYVGAYLDMLQTAVRDRIRSPSPVSALLSGGLDSPILSCIAARQLKQDGRPKLTTCSWVLPRNADWKKRDERDLIDLVLAQEDHIEGYFVEPRDDDMADAVARTTEVFDGWPISVPAALYSSAEIAQSSKARVLIGGFGGDQVATSQGVGDLEELLTSGRWRTFWKQARAQARYKNTPITRIIRGTLGNTWLQFLARPFRAPHLHTAEEFLSQRALVSREFSERLRLRERLQASPRFNRPDSVRVRDRQWFKLHQLEPELTAEKMIPALAMFNLDYRLPMLDKRLIEFCLSVPPEQHKHGWGRHLARRAAKGIIPETLRTRDDKTVPAQLAPLRTLANSRSRILERSRHWHSSTCQYVDIEKLHRRLNYDLPAALNAGKTHVPGLVATIHAVAAAEFVSWFQKNAAESACVRANSAA